MATTTPQVTITIDGKEHTVADDDMEAAALLRLAGRSPASYDLFVVDANGVEKRVEDEQIIDLRDDAQFRARRRVRFTIDGQAHSSWDDDQTAAALLRLAGVNPAAFDLALVSGSGTPHIFRDEELVRIEAGAEFVTAKHVGGVA